MIVEVVTPPDFTGEVINDINSRRGRILAMEPKNKRDHINGEVPLSEMFGYSTDLRSKTQGRATFSMQFEKYEKVPDDIAHRELEKRGISI